MNSEEGRVLYKTRQQRKSISAVATPKVASPRPKPPSLDIDVLVSVIGEYISIEEILRDQLYLISRKFQKKLLKHALIAQPDFIENPRNRRWFWMTSFCAKISLKQVETDYQHFLSLPRSADIISEVERDIVRTLPSHPLFALSSDCGDENREKLRNVLLALVSAEPTVGYCQGMNFVAAILLLNLEMDCAAAFGMFIALIREYHFKHLYSPSVPLLPLRMFCFSRLVRQYVPQVWHHLNSKTFSVEIFANQWIMTLFAYYLEPGILGAHIWTLFFLQGWKIVYQIGLAILALLENEICAMDVEQISSFMASSRQEKNHVHPFSNRERMQQDLRFAMKRFHIKNSDLDKLAHQFLSEKLKFVMSHEMDGGPQVSRCLGFAWVEDSLRIDLSAFATPNRPHERLSLAIRNVDVPIAALNQIQRTLDLVETKINKEMAAVTQSLKDVERRLLVETKQFNALVVNATRVDEIFKEAAFRKTEITELLQSAVTEGNTDVRALLTEMSEIEREYDSKKEQRITLYDIISEQEDKLAKIGAEKTNVIIRISNLASELENIQTEVISRSILSAIDSFSSHST
jgi:hypothetical protein